MRKKDQKDRNWFSSFLTDQKGQVKYERMGENHVESEDEVVLPSFDEIGELEKWMETFIEQNAKELLNDDEGETKSPPQGKERRSRRKYRLKTEMREQLWEERKKVLAEKRKEKREVKSIERKIRISARQKWRDAKSCPAYWTSMIASESKFDLNDYLEVQVNQQSSEFKTIVEWMNSHVGQHGNKFVTRKAHVRFGTVGGRDPIGFDVKQIVRIQNLSLWRKFQFVKGNITEHNDFQLPKAESSQYLAKVFLLSIDLRLLLFFHCLTLLLMNIIFGMERNGTSLALLRRTDSMRGNPFNNFLISKESQQSMACSEQECTLQKTLPKAINTFLVLNAETFVSAPVLS